MKKILQILAVLLIVSGCATTGLSESLNSLPAADSSDSVFSIQVIDYSSVEGNSALKQAFQNSPYRLPDIDGMTDNEKALLQNIKIMAYFSAYGTEMMTGSVYTGDFTAQQVATVFEEYGFTESTYGDFEVFTMEEAVSYGEDNLMVSGTEAFVYAYLDVKSGAEPSILEQYPHLKVMADRGLSTVANIQVQNGFSQYQFMSVGNEDGKITVRLELSVANQDINELEASGRASFDSLVEMGKIPGYELTVEDDSIIIVVSGLDSLETFDFKSA